MRSLYILFGCLLLCFQGIEAGKGIPFKVWHHPIPFIPHQALQTSSSSLCGEGARDESADIAEVMTEKRLLGSSLFSSCDVLSRMHWWKMLEDLSLNPEHPRKKPTQQHTVIPVPERQRHSSPKSLVLCHPSLRG